MNETDFSLLSFDNDVEAIIKNGEYSWQELKYLYSLFLDAQSQDNKAEDIYALKPPSAVLSLMDRFIGYKPLVAFHYSEISLLGYSLRQSNRGKITQEIHHSGILWNKNYFFTLNSKFEMFGINRFEFELGELDHAKRIAFTKSRVIFQGIEGSSIYPRIYLAVLENGKLM